MRVHRYRVFAKVQPVFISDIKQPCSASRLVFPRAWLFRCNINYSLIFSPAEEASILCFSHLRGLLFDLIDWAVLIVGCCDTFMSTFLRSVSYGMVGVPLWLEDVHHSLASDGNDRIDRNCQECLDKGHDVWDGKLEEFWVAGKQFWGGKQQECAYQKRPEN